MVSTLIVLALAASSLVLAWTILRPGLPEIRDLDDWEAKRHEVDLQAFRMLLDGTEQRYLRTSLPPRKFREFQRKRTALALQSLNLVGKNAQMLMKLGNLAKMGADPALAKQARIQGVVVLEAEISKEGTIDNLKVVTGHPLLIQAAIDAVKQWRYKPTLLNGEPVPVVTTITVNFAFSQ